MPIIFNDPKRPSIVIVDKVKFPEPPVPDPVEPPNEQTMFSKEGTLLGQFIDAEGRETRVEIDATDKSK